MTESMGEMGYITLQPPSTNLPINLSDKFDKLY